MDPNTNNPNNQQTPQQTAPIVPEPVPVQQVPQTPQSTETVTQSQPQSQPQPPADYFQSAATEPPKTPPIAPEPIEQPAPESSQGTLPPKKKSNAGLVIILILIILITLGILGYILLNYMGYIGGEQESVQQPVQTQEVTVPEPSIASGSADTDIKAFGSQSDSDEIDVIEADITKTDFANLDKEVDSINNQL